MNRRTPRIRLFYVCTELGAVMIAACALFTVRAESLSSFNVPLEHPVYSFIDMLPLPAVAGGVSISNRPFSAAGVCTLLTYARAGAPDARKKIIDRYLEEFDVSRAISPKKTTVSIDGIKTSAIPYIGTDFRLQDSGFSRTGFTAIGVDNFSSAVETANKTAVGARLYSNLRGVLAYFDGAIITEYGSKEQWKKINDPQTGRNYTTIMAKDNMPGHLIGYDGFNAYVKTSVKRMDIQAGFDQVSWGYAGSSGLLFSGAGRSFPMVKTSCAIGKLDYTFVFGKLTADTYDQMRLIYAKHMSFSPVEWFGIGLSDAVVSTDASLKLPYLLPFAPYYFIEHYSGGNDNRIMSFDAFCLVRRRVSLYGELLIDEISNLLGFVTNKKANDIWGGICGIKWHNPIPAVPLSALKLEFVQLEPWAYSRYDMPGEIIANNPVNFGNPIGNRMGPHARSITLDLNAVFSEKWSGSVSVANFRKGAGPGSSIVEGNDFIFDTLNGEIIGRQHYTTKEYRFKNYAKNRYVLSIDGCRTFRHWLQWSFFGDLVFDRVPAAGTNFRLGTALRYNY
jgi:hypothetical protein